MRRILPILFLVVVLVACGGGGNEPAADNSNTNAEVAEENTANADTDAAAEEDAADEAVASEEADTAADEEDAASEADDPTEETGADNSGADASDADGSGEALYSGIDPETGLEINPEPIPYGVDFIVRGEIIQFNLTPQTEPEFVIRVPDGLTYRIATQGLDEIFLFDGSQLKPFEYKNGMEAMATAFLPADASLSDTLTSSNFVIIAVP